MSVAGYVDGVAVHADHLVRARRIGQRHARQRAACAAAVARRRLDARQLAAAPIRRPQARPVARRRAAGGPRRLASARAPSAGGDGPGEPGPGDHARRHRRTLSRHRPPAVRFALPALASSRTLIGP